MAFREKSIVRHRLKPEWGAGRILLRNDEYLQIDFSVGGLKKLKTVIADEHLEAAKDDEVRPEKPRRVKAAATAKVTPAATAKVTGAATAKVTAAANAKVTPAAAAKLKAKTARR